MKLLTTDSGGFIGSAIIRHLVATSDQRGTPTAAKHLAAVRIRAEGWRPAIGRIFHATSMGDTAWHGFAEAILETAETLERQPSPTPTKRPTDSRLNGGRLAGVFGLQQHDWRGE
jgi:dTDP-4-dehydrorhamnose reductase